MRLSELKTAGRTPGLPLTLDLADAAARERHTFDALARNREQELDALAHRLLQTAPRHP